MFITFFSNDYITRLLSKCNRLLFYTWLFLVVLVVVVVFYLKQKKA